MDRREQQSSKTRGCGDMDESNIDVERVNSNIATCVDDVAACADDCLADGFKHTQPKTVRLQEKAWGTSPQTKKQ